MAIRNNRQAIPQGPGFENVFATTAQGGSDGDVGARGLWLSCAPDATNALEYRLGTDPSGDVGYLNPGEGFLAEAHPTGKAIELVQMRGVGGASIGGVEIRH